MRHDIRSRTDLSRLGTSIENPEHSFFGEGKFGVVDATVPSPRMKLIFPAHDAIFLFSLSNDVCRPRQP